MSLLVATFYRFFDFADYAEARAPLKNLMLQRDIRGTILLAPEGINATVSGMREDVYALLDFLKARPELRDLEHKEAEAPAHPFQRTKVRLKKEIITFGYALDAKKIEGTHVAPAEWNRVIADPDVVVLDSRNSYEVEHGTFERAIDPGIRTFTQLKNYVQKNLDPARHKKVATFCTGGVRCEKLSGWLKDQGFEEVYQLQGGILKYLQEVPQEQSAWNGECFVFDERVAVGHI